MSNEWSPKIFIVLLAINAVLETIYVGEGTPDTIGHYSLLTIDYSLPSLVNPHIIYQHSLRPDFIIYAFLTTPVTADGYV